MRPVDRQGVGPSNREAERYFYDVQTILYSRDDGAAPRVETYEEAERLCEDLIGAVKRLKANLVEAGNGLRRETQVLPHERAEMRSFAETELDRAVEPHVDNEGHEVHG